MTSQIPTLSPADLRAVAEIVLAALQSGELGHAFEALAQTSTTDTPVMNLSVAEACKRIGYGDSWLYAQQKVPGSRAPRIRKAGRRSVVRSDEVERFVLECPPLHENPSKSTGAA